MAPKRREGRAARQAGVTTGVWCLAWPAATGDLAHEYVVAGRCLTVEGLSGNFRVMTEPKQRSGRDWTGPCGHGQTRQRDVLWLWIMIGSQRTCQKPSKQRPMCAYVVRVGQRCVAGLNAPPSLWLGHRFPYSPRRPRPRPRPRTSPSQPQPVVTVAVTAAVMVAGAVESQASFPRWQGPWSEQRCPQDSPDETQTPAAAGSWLV